MDKLIALINRSEGVATALIRYRAEMKDALYECEDLDPSTIDSLVIQAEAALMGLHSATMPWYQLKEETKKCKRYRAQKKNRD